MIAVCYTPHQHKKVIYRSENIHQGHRVLFVMLIQKIYSHWYLPMNLFKKKKYEELIHWLFAQTLVTFDKVCLQQLQALEHRIMTNSLSSHYNSYWRYDYLLVVKEYRHRKRLLLCLSLSLWWDGNPSMTLYIRNKNNTL